MPKSGIQVSYIDQRGYDGEKLVEGMIKNSENNSPALNNSTKEYIENLLLLKQNSSVDSTTSSNDDTSILNSFENPPLIITQTKKIKLSNLAYSGQIIIESDSAIEVDQTAQLTDVILIAPTINIKNDVKGTFQAIASDSITIGKNCNLQYPSAIVLLKNNENKFQTVIKMMDSSAISGGIYSFTDSADIMKTVVELGDKTIVNGIVYVQGYLSPKGVIYGTVITNYLLFKKSASVYLNYLVDAEINKNKMSKYYVGPDLFAGNKSNKIIKWAE